MYFVFGHTLVLFWENRVLENNKIEKNEKVYINDTNNCVALSMQFK